MSIDLANVNISLDQFQSISDGEYNAGEVKLDTETTLKKVNHHVHMKGLNKVELSHAEVLAIKNAFVRALSQNGVNKEELARVCRDLGLAPNGEADKELRKRSVKPLSRQQIRDILDRNAGVINSYNAEHGEAVHIRTSEEIYGEDGMDADHTEKRDAVNATLSAPTRRVYVHEKVSLLQAIVTNNVDFRSVAERNAILKLAEEQLEALMRECHCHPRGGQMSEIKYTLRSGQVVELQASMSEQAFAHRLEDIIVRLRSEHTPRRAEFAVREHFNTLASEDDKKAFLDSLNGAEQGGLKARAIAVKLFTDAGFTDYDTLALPNQLSDEDAIYLAKRLVTLVGNLEADAVRDDPIIRLLAQKPGVPVDDEAMAYVPATAPSAYNGAIHNWIDTAPEKVFPEFLQVLNEVTMEIRLVFGEKGLPNDTSLSAVFGSAGLARVFPADDLAQGIVRSTPDAIRAGLLDAGRTMAADRMLCEAVRSALAAVEGGVPGDAIAVKYNLCAKYPEMMKDLKAVQSSAEASEVLAGFAERIAAAARFHVQCKRTAAKVGDWARAGLAEQLGVPVASLAGKAVALDQLTTKARKLVEKMDKGEVAVANENELEVAFRDLAKQFVSERMQYLRKVDALEIPEIAKDEMKEDFLLVADLKNIDLDFIATEAAKFDVDELADALKENTPKTQVYEIMHRLSNKIDEAVAKMLDHKQDIGRDDTALPNQLFVSILMRRRLDLERLMDVFFARREVRGDDFLYGDNAPTSPTSAQKFLRYSAVPGVNVNADLVARLGTTAMPPLAAQALVSAVRAEIPGEHTAEEAVALFAPGTKVGEMLRQQLTNAPGKVVPSALTVLARGVIRGHAAAMTSAAKQITAQFAPEGAATQRALAMGYFRPELEMLRRTAELYQAATECSASEAIDAALDHTSAARRLFSYGGRFTASVSNFKNGLKLLNDFATWFAETNVQLNPKRGFNGHAPAGANATVLNAVTAFFQPQASYAYEKFLFEEIARNDAIPLKAENPEQVFGMEANPATRFVGRGYTKSSANSIAQLSPERRSLLYAVFDLLSPLGATEAEALTNSLDNFNCELIARVLKHYDEVAAMKAAGELTRENFMKQFFPDIENGPNLTNRQLKDYFTIKLLTDVIPNRFGGNDNLLIPIANMVQFSGAKFNEIVEAAAKGNTLPLAPGLASANGALEELDGTGNGGRKTLLMDLPRTNLPSHVPGGQPAILAKDNVYTFAFPDGTVLKSKHGAENVPDVVAANSAIADKVAQFCGNVHPEQLGSLYFALSQAGAGNINRGLMTHGIATDEHAPLTYTLSKNAETGAITIRYSEPEGLPVHFHWETTIATDGSTTSTDMQVEP